MRLEIQRHDSKRLLLRWLNEAGKEVSFCYLYLEKDSRQTVPVPDETGRWQPLLPVEEAS